MSQSNFDNKRILKNTLFLYARMILIMCIGLYTVREFLSLLGVEDYGIYNVIGGLVTMFSFLNGTLAAASQRYFSVELANNNISGLNKSFRFNITVYLCIIVLSIIALETIGLWFLNNKLIIPKDRLFAANVVYQFSIVAFALQMITVPYNALIISYERMSAFAYIGIFEAFFKIIIVIVLSVITWDKLIIFGLLTLVSAIMVTMSYIIYCRRKLKGCEYSFYWNSAEAKELVSFTGWHLLGTLSTVIRSQGINLLLNSFFNPAINAARAIAYQVYNSINQLSSNFFIALKPQMYKCYSSGEIKELNKLILRGTIICTFLVAVVSLPCMINIRFILRIWLKDVPDYTSLFTVLVLINGIIDSTSGCTICPALAVGNLKKFYLVTGTLLILNLPISYFLLKIGCPPEATMVVSIIVSTITVFARAIILNELMPFDLKRYCYMLLRLTICTIAIYFILFYIYINISNEIIALVTTCVLSVILHVVFYAFFVLDKCDREVLAVSILSKIKRNPYDRKA